MTSPSFNNEDKDAWLLKIELKREEPEEISKDEGIKKAMKDQAPTMEEETSLNLYLTSLLQLRLKLSRWLS